MLKGFPELFAAGVTPVLLAVVALPGATASGQGSPGFTEVTAAAGVSFAYTLTADNPYAMTSGGAAGDFDDDGWPDLFVVGGGGVMDGLFMNEGDGTFTNTAASAGLTQLYRGVGAIAADYDDDGDIDIYATNFGDVPGSFGNGKHKLWQNAGDATFTNVAVAAGIHSTGTSHDGFSPCWGDYDLDGDLDLFVCGRFPVSGGGQDNNRLFRNNLAETGIADFTDVTVDFGLFPVAVITYSYCGIFADMDDDHYPELLVAADIGTSRYFKNNGGTGFSKINSFMVPGDTKVHNGMGACIGDFNRDGLLDWYVTSIYPAWMAAGPPGNRLYLNQGDHQYQSLPDSAGVNDSGWGWGATTIDFDQDGWQDLIVANGQTYCDPVTLECFDTDPTFLFRNNGDNTFSEVHASMNLVNDYQSRGLITFDYDRDGDLDVVITSNPKKGPADSPLTGNLALYRNEVCNTEGPAAGANFLQVALDTGADPGLAPHGLGADVRAQTGAVVQRFKLHGGNNFDSQNQLIAHFGLGAATVVDQLTVTWPSGDTSVLAGVAANQALTISSSTLTWDLMGFGKSGVDGEPELAGSGPLASGTLNQLDLSNAAPSASATLVFGLAAIHAPFKGGVLVPAPTLLVTLATDAEGNTSLPFLFPPGIPAGVSLYFQYWISDAGATLGLSASNGLRGVTS